MGNKKSQKLSDNDLQNVTGGSTCCDGLSQSECIELRDCRWNKKYEDCEYSFGPDQW